MRQRFTAILIMLILVSCVLLYGMVNARIVRVKNVEYKIKGLDSALDGIKLLFLTDLKISDRIEAEQAARLIKRLSSRRPDVIIIGGDLTDNDDLNAIHTFFDRVSDVTCRGGKYMVYGDSDALVGEVDLMTGGFTLLSNSQVKLTLDGGSLVLAGLDGEVKQETVRRFTCTDEGTGTLILITHNPDDMRLVTKNNDVDLCLCGHTLGGQIKIHEFTLKYTNLNRIYYGETTDTVTPLNLISQGIGTEGLGVRIGTEPTAYMITLKGASK